MASSIGLAVHGAPTKIPIPNSQFNGSTSGIGGQSTENVQKYDATFGFTLKYVPGSKMFAKIGGYNYNGPTGNWGQRTLQKVNLRKQVSGAAGYLASNPLARIKHTKFITMNYGRQVVNPFLPRGGSVPRVIDTSNVEDPRSFYSDYNWGNRGQGKHDLSGGDYYTIPKNGEEEDNRKKYDLEYKSRNPDTEYPDVKAPHNSQYASGATTPYEQRHWEYLNPMSGRASMGANYDPLWGAVLQQKLSNLANRDENVEDPFHVLETHIPGTQEFARRRAASLTHIYDNANVQQVLGLAGTQASNMNIDDDEDDVVGRGKGGIGGVEGKPGKLRSNQKEKPAKMDWEKIKPVRVKKEKKSGKKTRERRMSAT